MAIVSVAIPYAGYRYFDCALVGIRAAAAERGHELDLWVEPPGPAARQKVAERIAAQLADPRYIGAIAMHFRLRGEQVQQATRSGKPVVLIGGPSNELPVVRLNDVDIARRAVQHLIQLGHHNIAHLGGSVADPDDFTIRADRIRGYSEAMGEAGLETHAMVRVSPFELGEATRAAHSLLSSQDRPTAVFAAVDDIAFGVLAAARSLRLSVPRDLSVVGIDDRDGAAEAGLTTMRQDPAAVGRAAAARLLGDTTADDQVIDVQLVIRTSTAPPRGVRQDPGKHGFLRRLVHRRQPITGSSASA